MQITTPPDQAVQNDDSNKKNKQISLQNYNTIETIKGEKSTQIKICTKKVTHPISEIIEKSEKSNHSTLPNEKELKEE